VENQYELTWRNKFLTLNAKSIQEMADGLEEAVQQLRAMAAKGVVLEDDGSVADDYAHLTTTDPQVAEEFGFVVMPPFEDDWGDEDDPDSDP
jgi:hypothetical protein